MKYKLFTKKYKQEGNLAHEYNALKNIKESETSDTDPGSLMDFRTNEIQVDLNNPLSIECQPSYDGTVNLIINDDSHPPRIVNSRFSVTEDNRYKIINRNQKQQTNIYEKGNIDQQTRLFRNINNYPIIDLNSISYFGQLKGGNYIFYIKYADNDYNKTDIVAESGTISIFKGTLYKLESISGTLSDEATDKSINLFISNIDTSFSNIYLYYTRFTSDMNGSLIQETYEIKNPYEITNNFMNITINGFEEVNTITQDQLNIKYNVVNAVKTQTQNQGMLFFGNVQGQQINNTDLQNISYFIDVKVKQREQSIGFVTNDYKAQEDNDIDQTEYYNPINIYYNLGYWPDEIYRLGIVYIMSDDSLSQVYNLRGCKFTSLNQSNIHAPYESFKNDEKITYIPNDEFISGGDFLDNTMGVFKIPSNEIIIQDYINNTTKPLYFEITLSEDILKELKKNGVKGYFIVRQNRIPTILCQGLSVGIDASSLTPMLYEENDNEEGRYISEGFLNSSSVLSTNYNDRILTTKNKQTSALISLDPCVKSTLQSTFDGSEYTLSSYLTGKITKNKVNNRVYEFKCDENSQLSTTVKTNTIFVNSDIPIKYINNQGFSTRAGDAENVKQISFFESKNYNKDNYKLLRGIFCPYLGLSTPIKDSCIYNIRIQNYSSLFEKEYFSIRGNDNSAFYTISNRYELKNTIEATLNVFRGDCYTNTVTIRLQRNFIDPDVPVNDLIVDPNTWKNNYNGYNTTDAEKWQEINRGDLNTVPIGTWVTFKCLSNYNLGLRSIDPTNVEEYALMGNPRSFYPLYGAYTSVSNKIEESFKLNEGYSQSLTQKNYFNLDPVPYTKEMFDNRIMFSNVQEEDAFKNAYRIFQGLSYKDIDRQYGAIVKLLQWDVNLLCIFEHGIAILPVNEKALLSTTTGQSIHMYGAGVLQNQLTLVSQDFGSTWQESIIRTPIGVYGVDAYAKKIWRFSKDKGFELISDAKIQRFLNDNINLKESDKYPVIALKNIKTHYNNYKGDIIFTFYNDKENTEWSICYNERLDKWITRYSWIPLYSENVNNIFYSLDKKRAEILSYIYNNKHIIGIQIDNYEIPEEYIIQTEDDPKIFETTLTNTMDYYNSFDIDIESCTSSVIIDDVEQEITGLEKYITFEKASNVGEESKLKLSPEIFKYKYKISESEEKVIPLLYWKVNLLIKPKYISGETELSGTSFKQTVGFVYKYESDSELSIEYDKLMRNGFYVHGRAGIIDQINYFDENTENQIKPTKWYDKQEEFEFEFAVNEPVGLHKIFNNLVIISNNVAPYEIEYEIIGDVYNFNKAGIFNKSEANPFKNVEVKYDPILNQYLLNISQECKDIKEYGRLKGNITYKEDAWYLTIDPIKISKENTEYEYKSTRIRDKWIKIRIKYKGKDLVLISAIKTMLMTSYS